MIELYPVFLNLKDRLCVVVGGGNVAERKVQGLLHTGAKIKVISPELTETLHTLNEEGKIIWIPRGYQPGDLQGAFLVITATNNPQVQKEVFQEAEERGIPCNIVDNPQLCSFIVPSLIRRGELIIAISTSGASPAVAKRLREQLELLFSEEFSLYLKVMRLIREEILNSNLSSEEKEKKLQTLALAPIFNYLKRGDYDLLMAILEKEGLARTRAEVFSLYKASTERERQD